MTATQPRPKLTPATGKPETIALQFSTGKRVSSRIPGAPDQMYYVLVDGRVMYLPLEVGAMIDQLNLKPGEPFVLLKRGGGPCNWEVRRDETFKPPLQFIQPQQQPPPPVNGQGEDGAAILARHYSRAIEIALQAVEIARSKGLMVTPSFEDIRCISSVLMISEQRPR